MSSVAAWNHLHRSERHLLQHPSEHVVRFVASLPAPDDCYGLALDIGCGSGRHLALLAERGFYAYGVDASTEAVAATKERVGWLGHVDCAPMTRLPHIGGHFDVVLAVGVFYYGNRADHDCAVRELYRVLNRGGRAFVVIRTDRDWRSRGIPEGEAEHGMEMSFLSEQDVRTIYGAFSEVSYEFAEWTTHGRERLNSDWLITLRK